jgi:hypothetical protein
MAPGYLGTELMNRGDRNEFAGDAYTTLSSVMVAFGKFEYVGGIIDTMVNYTDPHHKIQSYSLYWCLTLLEYTHRSGDSNRLAQHAEALVAKVVHAGLLANAYPAPPLFFIGWDERVRCDQQTGTCPAEGVRVFQALTVQTALAAAKALRASGLSEQLAADCSQVANTTTRTIKSRTTSEEGAWWGQGWGLHAAAQAITAGLADKDDQKLFFTLLFNDSARACSMSAFNSHAILLAFSSMARHDFAVAYVRLCWGTMLRAGKGSTVDTHAVRVVLWIPMQ